MSATFEKPLLMALETVGSPMLWAGFTAFILILLALDLGVFHRGAREVSVKEALAWSAVWVSLALAFNGLVWHWFGAQRGLEFLTGYLIETRAEPGLSPVRALLR